MEIKKPGDGAEKLVSPGFVLEFRIWLSYFNFNQISNLNS